MLREQGTESNLIINNIMRKQIKFSNKLCVFCVCTSMHWAMSSTATCCHYNNIMLMRVGSRWSLGGHFDQEEHIIMGNMCVWKLLFEYIKPI